MNDALSIEWWDTVRVRPYAHNPRSISEAAVSKVADSLREYGWRQPLVVDAGGVIIAGHTRLLAARELGLERVPVHVAAELPAEKVAAYRLMDNRSADEAQWDFDMLQDEFERLLDAGYDTAASAHVADVQEGADVGRLERRGVALRLTRNRNRQNCEYIRDSGDLCRRRGAGLERLECLARPQPANRHEVEGPQREHHSLSSGHPAQQRACPAQQRTGRC